MAFPSPRPRALFLDRDGVVNADSGYPWRPEDFAFVPGALDLCRHAAARGFLLVIVTNQSGIGRGLYTEAEYRRFTQEMLTRFQKAGFEIAAVYHCPYHPTEGVGPYRREHEWRKPNPGMFLAAAREFGLDLAASVAVGDGARDIEAARAAGVGMTIRVAVAGTADCAAGSPDAVAASVGEAAAWLAARLAGAR